MAADGSGYTQMDLAPGAQHVLDNLAPGLPGTDHQHSAVRGLSGIFIFLGMQLPDTSRNF